MRRMVGDDQDVYRVVVRRKNKVRNPEYTPGNPFQSYWKVLDETYDTQYGPYNKIGAARAVLTRETWDTLNDHMRHDVVEGWVEKATVTWERVQ